MHHLSFGRKEGRRLGNKNTILEAYMQLFSESFFDEMTAGSGGTAGVYV